MYLWCILLSLICYANASCAPVKNGHYHLTSIHDTNVTRECVWDLQGGIAYLELERYSGRFGVLDKYSHVNLTLGSNVVNIANGVIRFEGQQCTVETTTRLEFQLWIALVFHIDRVTVKVLAPDQEGPFVECFTFYYKSDLHSLSVSAYTENGMEQVFRGIKRRPPSSIFTDGTDSTKKSVHDLDRRLSDLEREMDVEWDLSSKMAAESVLQLQKFKNEVSSAVGISLQSRDRLSYHDSILSVVSIVCGVLLLLALRNNVKSTKKIN